MHTLFLERDTSVS